MYVIAHPRYRAHYHVTITSVLPFAVERDFRASNTDCLFDTKAVQALSSPLQAIKKAFPPIQQQTENTAITVRAMHDEVHILRREAQNSQERVLQEIIGLANHADHSSRNLDSAIVIALDSYSTKMNNLKHDLIFSQSQHTGEVIAKLEAMVGNIE